MCGSRSIKTPKPAPAPEPPPPPTPGATMMITGTTEDRTRKFDALRELSRTLLVYRPPVQPPAAVSPNTSAPRPTSLMWQRIQGYRPGQPNSGR